MSDLTTVGLAIAGGGLAMAVVFAVIARVRTGMTRGWTTTTGVVVDQKTGRPEGGMAAIYPTFQWTDQHGNVHQRTSNMRQSLGPRPGTRVPVKYDPASPQRAMIVTFAQSGRVFYAIAIAVALLGLVVGGYFLLIAVQMG